MQAPLLVVSVLVGVKRYAFGGGVMRIHVESMDTIKKANSGEDEGECESKYKCEFESLGKD